MKNYKAIYDDQMYRVESFRISEDASCEYQNIRFCQKWNSGTGWDNKQAAVLKPTHSLINIGSADYILPSALSAIGKLIIDAADMLTLAEDWDGANGKVIDRKAFDAASIFLVKYASHIYEIYGLIITVPEINPCGNGSVDIVWKTANARFLINFKNVNGNISAAYYGDLYNNINPIKSIFAGDTVAIELAKWMKILA